MKVDRFDLTEYFEYLDELREIGEMNMFGAAPYLEEEYALSENDARKILNIWMQTYDEDEELDDRVEKALIK